VRGIKCKNNLSKKLSLPVAGKRDCVLGIEYIFKSRALTVLANRKKDPDPKSRLAGG
jgi:hypothetical protein